MGFPGTLPVLNKKAVEKAAVAATALGCEVQEFSKFDRKNYFYPDLPMGYQISQFDKPLALSGKVATEIHSQEKSFGITRVHVENDAGKLTHTKTATLCDYNRAGAPLIEIVTEPDMRSPEEAQALAKEIQKILRFVGASDADMEKGMMRFDASISLRPVGDEKLYARTEIKNLNSFTALLKALTYEQEKQQKLWKSGTPPEKEITAGWVDEKGETRVLRDKESAHDYRYFPEPDIPPITFTKEDIESFELCVSELPFEKYKRYQKDWKISAQDALKLSETPYLASFFEKATSLSKEPKKVANILLSVVLKEADWDRSSLTPEHVSDVIELQEKGTISSTGAKEILEVAFSSDLSAKEIMEDLGMEQISDDNVLETWIEEVFAEHEQAVEDFRSGNERVLGFLVGQVMKRSGGKANPPMINKILMEKLKGE